MWIRPVLRFPGTGTGASCSQSMSVSHHLAGRAGLGSQHTVSPAGIWEGAPHPGQGCGCRDGDRDAGQPAWFWGASSERAALLFPGRREAREHRGAPPAAGESAGGEEPGAGQGKHCSTWAGEPLRVLIWPWLPLSTVPEYLGTPQRAGVSETGWGEGLG